MKKLLTLFTCILISSLVIAQQPQLQMHDKVNQNNKGERKEYKPAPEANATIVNYASKAEKEFVYNPADSPAQFDYNSNTYTELGWTTISVAETDVISGLSITYDWTTDSWPAESSFHLESPAGTSITIANGEASGSYTKNITDFDGETMNGDWILWIEDSYGDGGHQATNISFTLFPQEQYAFTLLVPEGEQVYAGESFDYTVTINNTGIEDDDFTPEIIGVGTWTYELYEADGTTPLAIPITIASGTSYDFVVKASVPSTGLAFGDTDTESFTVTSAEGGKAVESFDITTTALTAINPPVVENFDAVTSPELPLGWNTETNTVEWQTVDFTSYSAPNSIATFYDSANAKDDWFFTPAINLQTGITYALNFFVEAPGWGGVGEQMKVMYGNEPNAAAMTELIIDLDNMLYDTYTEQLALINVPADGEYYIGFHAYSPADVDYISVDDISIVEVFDYDAAVVSIDMRSIYDTEQSVIPEATVANKGLEDITFDVVMTINDGTSDIYTSTQSADILAGDPELTIAFDEWVSVEGDYTVSVEAVLATDENPADNILVSGLNVMDIHAYAGNTTDGAYNVIGLNDGTLYPVGAIETTPFPMAEEFDGSNVYRVNDDMTFGTVGPDGTYTNIGTLTGFAGTPTGLAWDWYNDVMYVMVLDGSNLPNLFTLDMGTLALTQVGSAGTGMIIGMDFADDGYIYGPAIDDNMLYQIDPATGVTTSIGDVGIDINFGQDVSFDVQDNLLYTITCGADYKFGTYDLATGAFTEILDMGTDQFGTFVVTKEPKAFVDPVYSTFDLYNEYDVQTNIIWGLASAVTSVEEGGTDLPTDQYDVNVDVLTINAEYFAGAAENDEYIFTVHFDNGENATLTVEVTDLSPVVTWPTATDITYEQTLAESTLENGSAHVPGDPTTEITGTFEFADQTIAPDAGTYEADVVFTPDSYESNNPVHGTVTVTVDKAIADITLSDLEYTYDGTDQAATVTTDPAGLSVVVEYLLAGISTTPNVAGTYVVNVTIDDVNYEGTASDDLIINKAPLSITANSFSKTEGVEYVFDGTEFSTTPADLFASDEVTSVTLTSDGAEAAATIGDYEIFISDAVGVGLDNYDILYVNGTLTVTDKITLTIDGLIADDKVYDGITDATISDWGTLIGVVPGDDVALDVTNAVATFNNSNVGTDKTVTVSGLDLTGADAVKYVINDQTTSADITVKDLAITAEDKEKVYGDVDPEFTVVYEGFVAGQDETVLGGELVFDREPGEDVAIYLVTPSGLTSSNYNITFVDGTLSITPAPLSITADDKEKVYGDDDPEFTVTYDGFVFDEDETALSGALIIDREVGEDVGFYMITPSGLDSDNYDIVYVNGMLEITVKELTVTGTFTVLDKVYDATVDATIDENNLGLSDVVGTDDVELSNLIAEFAQADAATDIEVMITNAELTGTSLDNYVLVTDVMPTATADILPREVNIAGTFTVLDKYYDGTTDATIDNNELVLENYVDGEEVLLIDVVAEFADPNVGEDILVTIVSADISGADVANYTLTLDGAPTTTADIMAITYTVTFSVDGENGTIMAEVDDVEIDSGAEVEEGSDVLFTATPDEGYKVAEWTIDGDAIADYAELTYLLENLDQNVTVTVSFEEVVGISEISSVDISVFPNPARDMFTVESSELIKSIKLYNINGQMVKELDVDAIQTQINVSSLRTGVYFMKINTTNSVTTERVQITR